MHSVYDSREQLPSDLLRRCRSMPLPTRLLMCPPTEFDVVDVKNPHMAGHVGGVDRDLAARQWGGVRDAFEACGTRVELIDAVVGCEDMVFCANQTLAGLDADGALACVLSEMKHASRQREVPAFAAWFERAGYRVEQLEGCGAFEGGGDAIWHPGRALLWGGYGHRSAPEAYERIAEIFDVPVIRLRLISEHFYHLDTCFCALDERTVLLHAASFEPGGLEMIRAVFENVIECDDREATEGMACNATAIGGQHVVIQSGNPLTVAKLREHGYEIHEVETSEFLKSGGSVFCMKMLLF